MPVHRQPLDLTIAGPRVLAPPRHGDERGFFSETWSRAAFASAGIDCDFVQDNHSLSRSKGTVRGLHFQTPPFAQAKLVRVTRGAILDVAVDLRAGSPTFGRHVAVELSAANWRQLFVPQGFVALAGGKPKGTRRSDSGTEYRFELEDGSSIEVKGNEQIEYDGEMHTAANLFDALKEGYYGKF